MSGAGALAGIVRSFEFAARRWAGGIDRTRNASADLPFQRDAARRRGICAGHADELLRDRNRHCHGNPLPPGEGATRKFDWMKIDAEGSAAGAAGSAGIDAHRRSTAQR